MPRTKADSISERRVNQLVSQLFSGLETSGETIADIARRADRAHETVRRLHRNPTGANRSGPGFFIVAAIAKARSISLDELTETELK
jgi:hypothetical protein